CYNQGMVKLSITSFKLFQLYLVISITLTTLTYLFLTYRYFFAPDMTFLFLSLPIYAVVTLMAGVNILTSIGLLLKKKWAWALNLVLTIFTLGGLIYVSFSLGRFQFQPLLGPVVLIIFLVIHRKKFLQSNQVTES